MSVESLQRYARLLVEQGVDLRPDQRLFVRCERVHRDLALAIAEAAYDLGARHVDVHLGDPLQNALFIRRGRPEDIDAFHDRDRQWFNEVVRTRSPLIQLVGEEYPALAAELARTHPEAWAAFLSGFRDSQRVFLEHGIGRRICPWVIAPAATEGWARIVFPRLAAREAERRLASLIFAFAYADREDGSERLAEQARRLQRRARYLDQLAITEVEIHGGGNALRVRLSERARWRCCDWRTIGGQRFRANLPSEEVFTTPDRRFTDGRLVMSRPFRTPSCELVRDLVLHFRQGRIVEFDASEGREAFARWLNAEESARFLGEIALVGSDSAIADSGLFFDKTLLDENAGAHVALGQGFPLALAGGETASKRELDAMGCNLAGTHTDVTFGSPRVTIVATRSRRGEVVLLDRGSWVEPLSLDQGLSDLLTHSSTPGIQTNQTT